METQSICNDEWVKKKKEKKGGSRGPGRVETPVFLSHLRALSLSSSLLVNHCFHSVLSCRKWWSICVFVERESERERERDKEGNPWESVIHQRDTAPTPPWATACARPHVCQPAAAGHTEWWLSTFLHNKALFIMHLKSHSRYVWTHFICLSFCIDFLNKPSLLSSHPEAAFSSCWCRLVHRVFNLLDHLNETVWFSLSVPD